MKRYLSFFMLALALGIAPGPDILFVLAQSLAQGWQAGSFVTFGLCTGLIFHVSLAAFGIAAVLKKSPALFKAVTWLGAVYLVALGIGAWRAAGVVAVATDGAVAAPPLSPLRLYLRGCVMNALNPKVMLFFLALLPRFVVPQKGRVVVQFLLLGLVFALATVLVFHAVAFGGGCVSQLLGRSTTSSTCLLYFSALVMFGIAGWIGWMNLHEKRGDGIR